MYLHATSFVVTNRLVIEMRHRQDEARFVVLPPPCPLRVAPHDFSQASTLITASYQTAATFLDGLDPLSAPPLPLHLIRMGEHHPF